MTLNNVISSPSFPNLIALAAFILSCISLYFSYKININNKIFQNEQRKKEEIFQLQLKNRQEAYTTKLNRVTSIPYFAISLNGKIMQINEFNKPYYIIPVKFTNLGTGSAINIGLKKTDNPNKSDGNSLTSFFETSYVPFEPREHAVQNWFDEHFCKVNDSITFVITSTRETVHTNFPAVYDVSFSIHFNDVIGRLYTQKFKIQYSYQILGDDLSYVIHSDAPKCINEKI